MADEKPVAEAPEAVTEVDIEAVDDLSQEDIGKLQRGEIEPPKKGAKAEKEAPAKDAGTKDEFDVDPKSETVPHGQFHRVNERRKAAETERQAALTRAEQAEARANLSTQRLAELLEASKPAPVQQEEPEIDLGPDPDEDPIGALRWARDQRAKDIEARRQWEAQRGQQTEAQQIIAVKQDEYAATREQFPAIEDARQVVLKGWAREFAFQGFRGPALKQKVDQMEADYAVWAHRQNIPIGNVIAELAMARGWQPPADDDGQAQPANGAVNGHETPRDANGQFTKAAADMDKREQTRQAAKSLGGSGGPSDGGELTPEMVLAFSDDEFAAFKKKHGENAMRKLMGGAR